MKLANKHILVAAALAAFGVTAGAQTPPPVQPGSGPAHVMRGERDGHADPARIQEHMARMQERMARRLGQFKQKLQLSPAQEGAWSSYIAALKPSGGAKRMDRQEVARLTTPERIDHMRARRAERSAELDRRADATKTFYAALNPQQRKVFDDATASRARGGRGEGGGWGGHHGRHHRG
jgi:periplasmic protein CpxP/Spy